MSRAILHYGVETGVRKAINKLQSENLEPKPENQFACISSGSTQSPTTSPVPHTLICPYVLGRRRRSKSDEGRRILPVPLEDMATLRKREPASSERGRRGRHRTGAETATSSLVIGYRQISGREIDSGNLQLYANCVLSRNPPSR